MALTPVALSDFIARVGQEVGLSDWIMVGQDRIDHFAAVTEDRQFIHTDPDRAARETNFGGTIAHGYLTLSLVTAMFQQAIPPMADVKMSINYGLNNVRFLAPLRSGKRVRARFVLQSALERSPGQWQLIFLTTVEIEGIEKPALVMESIVLLVK